MSLNPYGYPLYPVQENSAVIVRDMYTKSKEPYPPPYPGQPYLSSNNFVKQPRWCIKTNKLLPQSQVWIIIVIHYWNLDFVFRNVFDTIMGIKLCFLQFDGRNSLIWSVCDWCRKPQRNNHILLSIDSALAGQFSC